MVLRVVKREINSEMSKSFNCNPYENTHRQETKRNQAEGRIINCIMTLTETFFPPPSFLIVSLF